MAEDKARSLSEVPPTYKTSLSETKIEPSVAPANSGSIASVHLDEDGQETPTDDEMATLRRVTGTIPWITYSVAFVEFCERFSYYGTTAVCTLTPPPKPPTASTQLTLPSRQLHSEASPAGIHHWCWLRRAVRCSRHGPARVYRPDNLQLILGLCYAPPRCLHG